MERKTLNMREGNFESNLQKSIEGLREDYSSLAISSASNICKELFEKTEGAWSNSVQTLRKDMDERDLHNLKSAIARYHLFGTSFSLEGLYEVLLLKDFCELAKEVLSLMHEFGKQVYACKWSHRSQEHGLTIAVSIIFIGRDSGAQDHPTSGALQECLGYAQNILNSTGDRSDDDDSDSDASFDDDTEPDIHHIHAKNNNPNTLHSISARLNACAKLLLNLGPTIKNVCNVRIQATTTPITLQAQPVAAESETVQQFNKVWLLLRLRLQPHYALSILNS